MDNQLISTESHSLTAIEEQIATLFVGNKRVREIRYQQELVNLLQANPRILQLSLSLTAEQSNSFILLLIKQVLEYSLNYHHEIYKPYRPSNQQEKDLLARVLDRHFTHLGPNLIDLFDIREAIVLSNEATDEPQQKSPEDICLIPDLRDPGLREDFLQELWIIPKKNNFKIEDELMGSYPSWARGIILDMQRTSYLFKKFKESNNHTYTSREDIKYQPHHQVINILISSEFYWTFNKREVNLSGKMTNAEQHLAIQDYLYTLTDQFLRLLPENHPYRIKTTSEERRDWEFERLKGILGAKKVLANYTYAEFSQKIECTEYSINLKAEALKDFTPSGMRSKKLIIKEFANEEIDNINYTDPGLDEEFLWDLYGIRSKKSVTWNFKVDEDWPTWAHGILGSMVASNTIYEEFLRSKDRSKTFQNRKFQPHHVNIRMLIAAEYFWLYNSREVQPPEPVNFMQIKSMQKKHIYDIYEGFLELLSNKHHERTRVTKLDRELEWSVEKIRGSVGASKVVFMFNLNKKSWLIEVTGSSIVTKPVKKNT